MRFAAVELGAIPIDRPCGKNPEGGGLGWVIGGRAEPAASPAMCCKKRKSKSINDIATGRCDRPGVSGSGRIVYAPPMCELPH